MQTKAFEIATMYKPLDDGELEALGGLKDDSGVWTFPDGSRLKAAYKPLPVFANADMTDRLGMCYFDILD